MRLITRDYGISYHYDPYLCFTAAATAYSNAFYGQGSGPILMDNVACTGVENGLINCTFDNNTGDCRHSEDAGVRCFSPPSTGEYWEVMYTSEEQYD